MEKLKGILKSIDEVLTKTEIGRNSSTLIQTTLTIQNTKGPQQMKFFGLISTDSIGNPVEFEEKKDGNFLEQHLHDLSNGRKYTSNVIDYFAYY